jgi:DNA polymerase III epsilon subunit-like protein
MPTIIVFDTETNGLSPEIQGDKKSKKTYNYYSEYPVPEEWPRIVQFSYIVYNTDSREILYITEKPDDIVELKEGVTIPHESFSKHGISLKMSRELGKPIKFHIDRFITMFETHHVETIVAHNAKFDVSVLCAELTLLIIESESEEEKEKYSFFLNKFLPKQKQFVKFGKEIKYYEISDTYCTLKNGNPKCKLASVVRDKETGIPTGEIASYYKNPKLEEAHKILFGENVNGELHNSMVDVAVTLRVFMKIAYNVDIFDESNKQSHEQIYDLIKPSDVETEDDFPLQVDLKTKTTHTRSLNSKGKKSTGTKSPNSKSEKGKRTKSSNSKGGKSRRTKRRLSKKKYNK